jgi:hypothetical protein
MIWNREDCGLLTCTVSGGVFEKDKKYPFCRINGNTYVIAIDTFNVSQSSIYDLVSFEDGTYKILGTWDDLESAVFVEEVN